MTPSPLAKKLGIKKGMHALIVGAPDGYTGLLAPLPEGIVISTTAESGDQPFIQLFATSKSEIRKSASALLKCASNRALVWIAYPKKSSGVPSDLSREEVRDAMAEFGWHAVSIVSIDDVWSALRFLPAKGIKSARPPRA